MDTTWTCRPRAGAATRSASRIAARTLDGRPRPAVSGRPQRTTSSGWSSPPTCWRR